MGAIPFLMKANEALRLGNMKIHSESSSLKGKEVTIKKTQTHRQFPGFGGSKFVVEDWWDKVSGKNWFASSEDGNIAAFVYLLRSIDNNLPPDNEVVYGKLGPFGCLVHISEIE